MKYTIEGFNQSKSIECGLDIIDLVILRWIIDFLPKMSKRKIDDTEYYWINYQAFLDDMPILGFKTKDRLYRKLKKMTEKKILKHKNVKNANGNFSYYALGENYFNLIDEPYNDEKEINLEQLADNFNKIWEKYPRKEGKNTAFNHYKSWLKGKKYAGRIIKLNNRQMWLATKKYADLIEQEKREKQFIKMGSTFFNEAIMEYVDGTND